jgi:hypothetical protein
MIITDVKIDKKQVLLEIIRADRGLSELESIGIEYHKNGQEIEIKLSSQWDNIVITPSLSDILTGYSRLSISLTYLKKWADFILSASNCIDLSCLENDDLGEEVLNKLWDISFSK